MVENHPHQQRSSNRPVTVESTIITIKYHTIDTKYRSMGKNRESRRPRMPIGIREKTIDGYLLYAYATTMTHHMQMYILPIILRNTEL